MGEKKLRKPNQTLFLTKSLNFVVVVVGCLSVKVFMELMLLILQNGGCRRPAIRKKKMDTLL